MPQSKEEIIDTRVSKLETRAALSENKHEDNFRRITSHKKEIGERIDQLLVVSEKITKVLWEDGLVSAVKSNSEWIEEEHGQKNKTINFMYRSIIFIILTYIATKVGLN